MEVLDSEDKAKQLVQPVQTRSLVILVKSLIVLAFAALGTAITYANTNNGLRAFSFYYGYHLFILGLIAWGIIRAARYAGCEDRQEITGDVQAKVLVGKFDLLIRNNLGFGFFRLSSYLGFALVVFYPIFRCCFTLPYLFCHVCPKKCVFGVLRPYLVPGALIMNIERRHWCYHACPLATLHDCEIRNLAQAKNSPRWFYYCALASLAFTVFSYFKLKSDLTPSSSIWGNWYDFFLENQYAPLEGTIVVTLVLLVIGLRYRRVFCSLLCPVGTLSGLVLRVERQLVGCKNSHRKEG
jgi:hypothetical protein